MHGILTTLSRFRTALLLLHGLRRIGSIVLMRFSESSALLLPWVKKLLRLSVMLSMMLCELGAPLMIGRLLVTLYLCGLLLLMTYRFRPATFIGIGLNWLALSVCSMLVAET